MKEGRNLTPVVGNVSVTSIVMPVGPGSAGTAVGTMAVRISCSRYFFLPPRHSSFFPLLTGHAH